MYDNQTTRITHVSWGHMKVTVGGRKYEFKDCKAWPGGAKAWDWNETGTSHQPGIQQGDIEEILDRDVEIMVLSRGMDSRLNTSLETEALLRSRGIEYSIDETQKAVMKFNKLMAEGRRVGGIFHSTC